MKTFSTWRSASLVVVVLVGCGCLSSPGLVTLAAEDAATIENRMRDSVKYLASDELEGRGVGTNGLDMAADYLAARFREIGLKTEVYSGSPFQKFNLVTGSSLGETNTLALVGPGSSGTPERIEPKLGEQFTPMSLGGSGEFDLPLVFVGYGITGKHENYDDYAGIDVQGKAVIVLRHEPQQNNPHSVFNGTDISTHAPYKRKISNAYEHGALAVIFVTDQFDIDKNVSAARGRWQSAVDQLADENANFKAIARPTPEEWASHEKEVDRLSADMARQSRRRQEALDPIVPFDLGSGETDGRNFPVLYCLRSVIEPVVNASLGKSLAELEAEIEKGPTPHSADLKGWKAQGKISVTRQESEVKNVVGIIEGEGPLANETIVLGAHYDHLGYGGEGSMAPGVKEIHNGADDNGSGTAVLLEIARRIATSGAKPPRRLVFIAFTGEERGLIGSARYVREPVVPLESTVAMLNLDMVGRLENEKLIVHGTGTANGFDELVDRYGKQFDFHITKEPGGFGPSDHASFYGVKVPVLFFFTGNHKDYHRPSDDYDKLNLAGMRRIGDMVSQIALELAAQKDRPTYQEVKAAAAQGGGGDRPYFGSVPDFSQDQPGYALSGVTKDGPADAAGLKPGDIIVQLGDSKIGNLEDFDSALRKHVGGEKVPVTVKRGGQLLTFTVTLEDPR